MKISWKPWQKWLVGLGALVGLVGVLLFVAAWRFVGRGVPSTIVDFHPTSFPATANAKFFYSIGLDLKYSDQIDANSPTLIQGRIKNFLVSPDKKMIAAVINGKLVIVWPDRPAQEVAGVDSIYREPKPLGRQFFRDDEFQWSPDSKILYLIRDEYYESKGSQLFSSKGELWRYNIESGKLDLVIKSFPAYNYFFARGNIYFSVPTDSGDLELLRFDGQVTTQVAENETRELQAEKVTPRSRQALFYSFSILDYQRVVEQSRDAQLVTIGDAGPEKLMIKGKDYLTVAQGQGLKGAYYCSEMLRSVFLPGDKYFVFNVPYCGNYNGQLLIDISTGKYQRLPAETVVYLTLNTGTYPRYQITGGGIEIK